MKRLLHTVLLLFPLLVVAQSPQGINYHAVAYDANGFELANHEISIRLGILLETADAESSYTENHQVSTNDFGLFSLVISDGTTTDDYSALNWRNGAFLKVELDANLDGNYTLMGINSFSSVPYALYSTFAENIPTAVSNQIDSLQAIVNLVYQYFECEDSNSCNYSPTSTWYDNCVYAEDGYNCDGECIDTDGDGICDVDMACPYPEYIEYDSTAVGYNDILCQTLVVFGCTDWSALNYESNANTDDGSCSFPYISPSQASNGDVLSVSMSGSIYDQYSQTTTNSVIRFSQYSSTNSFFGSLLEFNLLNSLYSYNYEALVELFIPEDQEVGTYTIEMGSSENSNDWTMLEHNFEIVPAPYGCTQQELADGSCVYYGCTDSIAYNYDEIATTDDESCLVGGCMNPTVENYNADANIDDESCIIYGCTLSIFPNYNSQATIGDGSCDMSSTDVFGCTDESTWTYQDIVTIDNGTCNYSELDVGSLVHGGIVFYVDETGAHGLVAAMEDLGQFEWGCWGARISGANGQAIGTGYQNTLDIVAGCSETNTAAFNALNSTTENYTDWYLPSKDELMEMYNTIGYGGPEGNIGGFENVRYWSSSEYYDNLAWHVNFNNGYSGYHDKYSTRKVRIIRAF